MSVTSLRLVHNIVAMYFLHNHETEIEKNMLETTNTPFNGYRSLGYNTLSVLELIAKK